MSRYNVHGGHNRIVPGASAILDEVTEDRKVKDGVISRLRADGHTVYDCTDDSGRTQGANLANIVAKCNKHTVDYDISIHLNSGRGDSSGDGKTGGVEVLIYSTSVEPKAKAVADAIASEFGYALRSDGSTGSAGVKIKKSLYVLKHTTNKAMLIECCFVDDADDAKVWNADRCAKAIVKGLTGKTVSANPSTSSGSSSTGFSSGYSGNSIVDYLNSIGKDSSFSARKQYAAQYGISNYKGTASQNLQLLNAMRVGKAPASSPSSSGGLKVDGYWGKDTTRRLQQIFGTTVDGVVSNQFSCYKAQNPGLDSGWEWQSNPSGYSPLIKAIQKKVGASQDGHIGPKTIKAIQKWMGTTQDGVFSAKSPCIKKLQQWCNNQ